AWSSGVSWGDYDNDGDLDLVVASGGEPLPPFLYRNEGDGNFTKITNSPVTIEGRQSVGCSWGDYDNDGFLDLFIANFEGKKTLFHNNTNGTFSKVLDGPIPSGGGESISGSWSGCDKD